MRSESLEYVQVLVYERSGIVLDSSKGYLVETRLAPVAKAEGLAGVDELVSKLRATGRSSLLHIACVEGLTTNETSFFRDVAVYRMIEKQVVPSIISERAATRKLRIWSAACSTGQEPYTLAMLLDKTFPQLRSWSVEITATDLDTQILTKARKGSFSQLEVNRGLPAAYLVKYFEKQGARWEIKEPIRKQIQFRQLNLTRPWPGMGRMDIVLLRNVLIYFDVETKRRILDRVLSLLAPGGGLILGGAETTMGIHDGYERVRLPGGAIYRRRDAASSAA